MAITAVTWFAVGLILATGRPARMDRQHALRAWAVRPHDASGWSQATVGPLPQGRAQRSETWWRGEKAWRRFGIDQERSKELEAIFQRTLPKLKSIQADIVRKEAIVLALLASAGTTRESEVVQAVEDLEASRRSLARTFILMQYHLYRRLTPEQFEKVYKYQHPRSAEAASRDSREE